MTRAVFIDVACFTDSRREDRLLDEIAAEYLPLPVVPAAVDWLHLDPALRVEPSASWLVAGPDARVPSGGPAAPQAVDLVDVAAHGPEHEVVQEQPAAVDAQRPAETAGRPRGASGRVSAVTSCAVAPYAVTP